VKKVVIILFALLACACAGAPVKLSTPQQEQRRQTAAEEEARLASVLQEISKPKPDYKISPVDLIDVTVYQDPDLTRKVRVSQNGTISLPLVGFIKIGGLTLMEAEEEITQKLKRYIIDPQVTLFIEEYGNQQIFVMGEVTKPGSYPMPPEGHLTVMEAISVAGGFTPVAAKDRTRVLRNVNGKNITITIDVSAITKSGEKDKDMSLRPNDVVYVPQSFF